MAKAAHISNWEQQRRRSPGDREELMYSGLHLFIHTAPSQGHAIGAICVAQAGPAQGGGEHGAVALAFLSLAVVVLVVSLWLYRRGQTSGKSAGAASLDALPPEAARSAAKRHRLRGQLEEAARLFCRAGDLEDAAICHEELGRHLEAAALYEAGGAWLGAARCFRVAQRPQLAAPLFEKAGYFREAAQCYELDGQFALAAGCHHRAGNSAAAIQALERAGDHYKLACARLLKGELAEAASALERVSNRHDDHGKARLLLAKVLADMGQPQRAVGALRDFLAAAPAGEARRQARIYLAKLLEVLEQDDEALTELESLRSEFPGDPVVERRWRRITRRLSLAAESPDSPQLRLRRITGLDMPSDLAPQVAEPFPAQSGPGSPGGKRFRTLERLEDTELSVVYRAIRVDDNLTVVLRVLRDQGWVRPEQRNAFLQSLKRLSRFEHPHVLRLVECGDLEGRLFAASAFEPAVSLAQWMTERGRPATSRRAVGIGEQLCLGVHAGHQFGSRHLSLDPSTVWLNAGGDVLINEYGLVASLHAVNPEAAIAAVSPYFSAPELVSGGQTSAATDVYAIGALLYFMLTGHPPFEQGALLKYWSRAEAPDPRAQNPDIPKPLASVVQRCLAMNAEQRYPTCEALLIALQTSVAEEPTAIPV